MRTTIGLDLGGTNLRATQVLPTGAVGATRQEPLDRGGGLGQFGQVLSIIEQVHRAAGGALHGVGVAVTGPVDPVRGWVDNRFTLPPSMQGDLIGSIRERYDVVVAIENDANAAAFGEALYGAGRGADTVVCVTIGTGIGVGVVERGKIRSGAGGSHPEAGHIVIDPSGPPCYCGATGCFESMASAAAVTSAGRAAGVIDAHGSALEVKRAAEGGDQIAREIIARSADALAAGVRALVAAYAPDAVVLAGGASGIGLASLQSIQLAASSFPFGARDVTVRAAELGGWSGCIGAAALIDRPGARDFASTTMVP